ncbi:MAG: Ribosomal protein S12 methylthiotransferase RimO [Candidatus Hydrogenedentes bacterium ADurb.Bin179]|nr:MAG: Ribosomal protein S12 methylthiotransferase RimO [Candidatus Hydrogenedentes bacterium ADurb.Bin179]
MTDFHNNPRIGIIVLGCDKNTADAEHFAGVLEQRLPENTEIRSLEAPNETTTDLDAVVIFTCAFIGDAKEESIAAILAWTALRQEQGVPRRIYVAGCLSQRYRKELEVEMPEVDGLFGIHELAALAELLCGKRKRRLPITTCRYPVRKRLNEKPYAFLKIADGCGRGCTFCIIPAIKGRRSVSLPKEKILADATALIASGVRELNLVAQDITEYGKDCYSEYRLANLLADLCALQGDFWIRCLYCYPTGITDATLEQLAGQPKVVPYLDIPLQHVSPAMLRAMGRPEKTTYVADLLDKVRSKVPGIVVRTTMMVGFPGETDADHHAMLDFIQAQSFPWLGAFVYSPEEDTPAASLKNRVPKRIAQQRFDTIMQTQAAITEQFNQMRIGTMDQVLIEGYDADMGIWKGRSRAEAPEVDGMMLIEHDGPLTPGQFIQARITRAEVYDVYGRVVRDSQ